MLNQLPTAEPPHDPSLAARHVVESAVELARAEARLLLVHFRQVFVRAVGAFLALMLATSAAQVTLLLVALSPVLFASGQPSTLLVALLPSVCLAGLGACLSFAAWRGLGAGAASANRRS